MSPGRKHVLIADDDEPTARILARFLRDYDVTIARNGREALELAIDRKPDLVISDVWMPELDGIEVVLAFKEDPGLRNVPVILLTAAVSAQHVARGISAGAKHFLPKPVQIDQLLRIVRRELAA